MDRDQRPTKTPTRTRNRARTRPENERPGTAANNRDIGDSLRKPDPENTNAENRPGGDRQTKVASRRNNAHSQKRHHPANINAGVQPEDDRPRTAAGNSNATGSEGEPNTANKNNESKPEDDRPGTAVSSRDTTNCRRGPNSANRNVGRQPEDDRPGAAANNRGNRGAPRKLDPAVINAEAQPRDNRPRTATNRSPSLPTQWNPDLENQTAEDHIPSQSRALENPGSNSQTELSHEYSEATGGKAMDHHSPARTPSNRKGKGKAPSMPGTERLPNGEGYRHRNAGSGVHPHGNPNKSACDSQDSRDTAVTGYTDQNCSLDGRRGSSDEGESSTRNQFQSDVQDTFDQDAAFGVRKEGKNTYDNASIHTSIDSRNTQGKFDSNSGSNNDYGDKDRKFVNKGTIVNKGNLESIFSNAGEREEPKNTGRFYILYPTYLPW
ncbi:hypothetical protein L873DRAFT_1790354 [Choiromyces venosus 120613-1]|uniref:Uncharacterized protein n=1 Tax=Choiromyces venosus 120613-1 TaxID=1336337 RepID=A0A3N4JN19_9PEZI|nr:hypothetical protein L873DRAFT_1790354 [Choiromyces venosus 120613-1]